MSLDVTLVHDIITLLSPHFNRGSKKCLEKSKPSVGLHLHVLESKPSLSLSRFQTLAQYNPGTKANKRKAKESWCVERKKSNKAA